MTPDGLLSCILCLINERSVLNHVAAGGVQDEVTLGIDFKIHNTLESQFDGFRVSPGRNHKVVFQLALVAVVNQVYSRIYLLIFNPEVSGYIGVPLLGIIADEVVDLSRLLLPSEYSRLRVRAYQLHTQHVAENGFRL